jgi:hypothetical protein
MKKFTAIFSSVLLHMIFITGFAATGTVATQIAADRASHALWS